MEIWSKNIDKDNYLENKHGMNTKELNDIKNNRNIRSFQVQWKNLPNDTKSLALTLVDDDSIPVCGFSWIHWTVANIDPQKLNELPDNASIDLKNEIIQGKSSWCSGLLGDNQINESGYGGCAPPDQNHLYTLTVYALNKKLDLSEGFYLNELKRKMENCILDSKKIFFKYRKIEN